MDINVQSETKLNHTSIIQAKDLSFKYPNNDYYSVNKVSLDIKRGQCLGIIGPNGAGKSTLISLLCGLLKAEQGEVEFAALADETPLSWQASIEKYVALIPQEYAFYPELSIKQNLEYFIAISEPNRKKQKQLLEQALTQCQLTHVAKQKAESLSGGYKRRLNIAIALSKSPEVIFLDEPTVGIDPVSRQDIVDLLEQLKAQGKTLIYTSHMLNEVEQLCDDIILLEQGKAIAVTDISNNQRQNMQISIEFFADRINASFIAQLKSAASPTSEKHSSNEQNLRLRVADISQLQQIMQIVSQDMSSIKSLHFAQNSIDQLYFDAYKNTQSSKDVAC